MTRSDEANPPDAAYVILVRLAKICFLIVALVLLHAFVLTFIFPGYYDPLWPHHSDMYILNATVFGGQGAGTILHHPRPFTQMVMLVLGQFDINKIILGVISITFFNIVLMSHLIRIWLKRPMDWAQVAAFLIFSFAVLAHPYFYIFYSWDLPSTSSLCMLLMAMWSYLAIPNRYLRFAAFTVFVCAGFLAKETYSLSFPFVMAVLAAGDILARRPIWKSALPYFAISLIAAGGFLLRGILMKSPFTASRGVYAVDLHPLSILKNLADFISAGLPGYAVLVFLAAILAVVLLAGTKRVALTTCVLVAAGVLTLVPNSVLTNHFVAGYSWNAAILFFSPLLLIPEAFSDGRNSRIRSAAIAAGALAFAVSLVLFWQKSYTENARTLEYEARQRRVITAIRNFAAEPGLVTGAVRILVSGLAPPFSPFDHGDSLKAFLANPNIRFDVVDYDPSQGCCVGSARQVVPKRAADIDVGLYDRVWAFRSNGSGALMYIQAPGDTRSDIPFDAREMILYPDLQDIFRGPLSSNIKGEDWLACGVSLLDYSAPALAERCLEKAKTALPDNPYPFYFLGRAWENRGDKRQARENYQRAVSLDQGKKKNPHFAAAVQRVLE